MFRYLSAAIFLFGLGLFASPAALAVDFLAAIEDIPVPETMTEAEAPVVFETPFGRIIQTSVSGRADKAGVKDFYNRSLPALGWTLTQDELVFMRGIERLEITLQAAGTELRVQYRLVARPASSRME